MSGKDQPLTSHKIQYCARTILGKAETGYKPEQTLPVASSAELLEHRAKAAIRLCVFPTRSSSMTRKTRRDEETATGALNTELFKAQGNATGDEHKSPYFLLCNLTQ